MRLTVLRGPPSVYRPVEDVCQEECRFVHAVDRVELKKSAPQEVER